MNGFRVSSCGGTGVMGGTGRLLTPAISTLCGMPSVNAVGWRWMFGARTSRAGHAMLWDASEATGSTTQRTLKMARLEAVLLVADAALAARKLAQLATLADAGEARTLIDRLNVAYDQAGCAFRVEQVAAGFRLMTRPQFAMWLDRLHNRQARAKLSGPMLETLAIVAYRQPLTRADVERVRGVQSSEMLKQLMERGFVRIVGEDDSLGRPFLYGTTRQFLEEYGLGTLDDLPMAESLRRQQPSPDASPEDTSDADESVQAGEIETPDIVSDEEPDTEAGTRSDDEGTHLDIDGDDVSPGMSLFQSE